MVDEMRPEAAVSPSSEVRHRGKQEDVSRTKNAKRPPDLKDMRRFLDCEKWRRSISLDDLVPSWEYTEKEEMFEYYPQYYHKTDKVLRQTVFPVQDSDHVR
jgi:hypothetical protein